MDSLNNTKIDMIIDEILLYLKDLLGSVIVECRVFGSCARGDYTEDSDIDVVLLTSCGRLESNQYDKRLARVMSDIMFKHNELVNFICIPHDEFEEKKNWYPFYSNIEKEGRIFYEE